MKTRIFGEKNFSKYNFFLYSKSQNYVFIQFFLENNVENPIFGKKKQY